MSSNTQLMPSLTEVAWFPYGQKQLKNFPTGEQICLSATLNTNVQADSKCCEIKEENENEWWNAVPEPPPPTHPVHITTRDVITRHNSTEFLHGKRSGIVKTSAELIKFGFWDFDMTCQLLGQ